ncbi:MAG: beta-ketoacyl-ACP synthase II [Chitinophagaceae bacterium]|nr:beta-ketoacyl-ACP synthase II [Chitinophagaceae bacterium]
MKRVVVTGMGAITPLGNNVKDFWQNVLKGKSGAASITRFDAAKFRTRFACQLQDYKPELLLDRNEIKRSDLFTQYALIAAGEAINDSGFDFSKLSPFDVGVIWGSGQGGMDTFEQQVKEYTLSGYEPRFSPFFVPKLIANMASGMISLKYGYMGINYTTVSACATSNTAIMDAFNYIRWGKAKIFITGGSEAPITEASVGGFSAMKAMSVRNEDPATAARPFDKSRDGFVMGEGAGALVLEEYEHAVARGAHIYAEIAGAAMTADAYHMTATHPEGLGALQAMRSALEDASLNKEDIDYLNTHATSTPVGDISEARAIHTLYGSQPNLFISATKSMTGHLLGAAGAIEAVICIKSITDSVIVPTINTSEIDEEVPSSLQIVLKEPIEMNVNAAMSNTFGFGGHNGIVVFKKI